MLETGKEGIKKFLVIFLSNKLTTAYVSFFITFIGISFFDKILKTFTLRLSLILIVFVTSYLLLRFVAKRHVRASSDYGKKLVKLVNNKIVEKDQKMWIKKYDYIIEVDSEIFKKRSSYDYAHTFSYIFKNGRESITISLVVKVLFKTRDLSEIEMYDFFTSNGRSVIKYFSELSYDLFEDISTSIKILVESFIKEGVKKIELKREIAGLILNYFGKKERHFISCDVKIQDPVESFCTHIR